ncbi:concanavalin A-like lectin/glucanase [Imleria badia]|nr:concanavalin A-like lectin/glucanase [Imleria badia]
MLFHSTLISTSLFASAVLADRRSEHHHSRFLNHVERNTNVASECANCAGALLPGSNGGFSNVTGTFTVPDFWDPNGTSALVEVGIVDTGCKGASFKAGVKLSVSDDGVPQYQGLYAWTPDVVQYSDINISRGDVIALSVQLTSPTTGVAFIENVTKQLLAAEYFTAIHEFCVQNAVWMIILDGQLPLVHFFEVPFSNGFATSQSGVSTSMVNGATLYEMVQNGQVLVTPLPSDSSLTLAQ